MVIDRILRENAIPGERLLAFGDGYVEIENTKGVGGLAVAVASDEAHNGSGGWTPGSGSGCWASAPTWSFPTFATPDALLDRSWPGETRE